MPLEKTICSQLTLSLSILLVILFLSCDQSPTNKTEKTAEKSDKIDSLEFTLILRADTTISIGNHIVQIKSPNSNTQGDILLLPGWNFSKEKTCLETSFCDRALAAGYRLVMPDMVKSTYATHYYPETRNDYRSFPTLTWVIDTMIPELKKTYGIFSGEKNILYGISTGARGAALVHLRTGKLFQKVVLLSGDYDQTRNHKDKLMINTYGAYAEFPSRWKTTDNPMNEIQGWSAETYIAHGLNDKVVHPDYSRSFADSLKKLHPNLYIELYLDSKAGHDFGFWESHTTRILEFLIK